MSNYLSAPVQLINPQSSINQPLIEKVLAVKQGRYDANKAKIDQTLAIYKNQLRGLRDVDNEYISARIKEAENTINNYGNRDFSLTQTTDTLLSSLKSITEDPIVQAAIVNKAKVDQYNLKVDEIKKKKPELYSNVNYQDSLELAGVDKYIKGQVKDIGSLQYSEYVNLPEKYNKKAEEYATKIGFEKVLDTTEGDYFYTDTKGKVVTKQEIYNRLSSELDEKDRAQLQINTRQSLGKMSAENLELSVNPIITQKLTQSREDRAKLQAQIDTETDKVKKDNLKLQLVNYDNKIKNYADQLDKKTYDLYGVYQEEFLNGIASNYDISAITDIKRDTTKMDVLKFEYDKFNDERNFRLKEREVSAKEKETEALTAPTSVEKPQTGEDQKPSEQILNEAVKDSDAALDEYLKKSNENGYKEKTPQEQWAYKTALKTGDPTMPIEKQNLIKNFSSSLEGKVKVINSTKESLKESTAELFNNVTGAKVDNLASEMPYTVAMLKQKKKFEELDGNQQAAVMLEMGSNVARHMASGREKNLLVSGLNSLDAKLKTHGSDKVKSIYSIAGKSFKNINQSPVKLYGVYGGLPLVSFSAQPFTQDTDVTEIEKGDANVDGTELFTGMLNNMSRKANEISDGYKENLSSNKALSWSTEDKYQKSDALRLQQAIQTNYPDVIPSETNNYIVNRKGKGFEVTFDTGTGDKKTRVTKYVEKLADETMAKFNLTEQDWHSNFYNPNIILPEFSFTPKMRTESYEKFKQTAKNRPDIVPTEVYVAIHNQGSLAGTEYQSDEDIMDWVQKQPNLTEEKQKRISEIINASYNTNYEIQNGMLLGTIEVNTPSGKKEPLLINSQQKELDEGKLYVETMQKINQYKVNKIREILNGGNR